MTSEVTVDAGFIISVLTVAIAFAGLMRQYRQFTEAQTKDRDERVASMAKTDAKIDGLVEDVRGLTTTIAGIDARLNAISSGHARLDERMHGLEKRVDVLEGEHRARGCKNEKKEQS